MEIATAMKSYFIFFAAFDLNSLLESMIVWKSNMLILAWRFEQFLERVNKAFHLETNVYVFAVLELLSSKHLYTYGVDWTITTISNRVKCAAVMVDFGCGRVLYSRDSHATCYAERAYVLGTCTQQMIFECNGKIRSPYLIAMCCSSWCSVYVIFVDMLHS